MLINILKHSFRALNRQKSFFLINITGLSIGISCSLIIALFIMHELSYDQFNDKKDRIYRLVVTGISGGQEVNYAISCSPIGPTMLRTFPEVEDFVRINTFSGSILKYQEKSFIDDNFIEADSSFFNIFSIPLLRGDKKNVLNAPYKLVLTESTAKKIFGNDDPVDKLIKVGNDTIPYKVTGIMADVPVNSHFKANMIGSFVTNKNANSNNWGNNNYITYILLKSNTRYESVNIKIPGMITKYIGPMVKQSLGISIEEFISQNKYNIYLQPLKDIHLNPVIKQNTKPSSNPKYLLIFGSVAILIILIAAINFMNLSTAQASKRAKEIGLKKVSGSSKSMLVSQLLSESIIISLISLVLAIIATENSLPYFNNLLGTSLKIEYFTYWFTLPVLLILSVFIGLLAGSYPAFFLSSFNPYTVLKGKLKESIKNGRFRSILVIVQFSISIILIVGTIIIFRQIQYMVNKDLGFNKEQLFVINRSYVIGNKVKSFKDNISKIVGVLKVTASTQVPGHSEPGNTYMIEGKPGEVYEFKINYVDYDFFDVYGIQIKSGRAFNESYSADKDACIINESTVKRLNLSKPFATRLANGFEKLDIIGITKNFHYESLHNDVNPYVFKFKNDNTNHKLSHY